MIRDDVLFVIVLSCEFAKHRKVHFSKKKKKKKQPVRYRTGTCGLAWYISQQREIIIQFDDAYLDIEPRGENGMFCS